MPQHHERLTQHDLTLGPDNLAVDKVKLKPAPCMTTLRDISLSCKNAREAADEGPPAPDRERRRALFTQAVDGHDALELRSRVLGCRETELEESFEHYSILTV